MTSAQEAQVLLERLAEHPELRARFELDPAATAHALGLHRLAAELAADGGRPLQALDLRESRSSLGGAFLAAAAEVVGLVDLAGHAFGAADAQAATGHSTDHLWNADQFGRAGTGGPPTPEVETLLHDHNVGFDASGIADLKAGRIDPRVVDLLTDLSKHHRLTISSMCSDHPEHTVNGSISNHYYGRAFDIATVDGQRVDAGNAAARVLALDLAKLPAGIRPSEIGSPWALPGAAYFTDADHQNHLHVGFDDPIAPDWKPPPGDAAAAPVEQAAADNADHVSVSDDSSGDGATQTDSSSDDSSAGDSAGTSSNGDVAVTVRASGAKAVNVSVSVSTDDSSSDDTHDGDSGDDGLSSNYTGDGDSGNDGDSSSDDGGGGDDSSDGDSGGDGDGGDDGGSDSDSDAPGEGSNGEDANDDAAASAPSDNSDNSDTSDNADGPDTSGAGDTGDGSDNGDHGEHAGSTGDDAVADPGTDGSAGLAESYPGDDASPAQVAAWMGAAAKARGLPEELPVMASLVESGLRNLNYGDADSVGFFQMRTSIWDHGAYAGYPDRPEMQLRWFLDHAEAVRAQRVARGESVDDPHQFGQWIADVERPAAQYRGRYQLRLDEARELLATASQAQGRSANDAQVMNAVHKRT